MQIKANEQIDGSQQLMSVSVVSGSVLLQGALDVSE